MNAIRYEQFCMQSELACLWVFSKKSFYKELIVTSLPTLVLSIIVTSVGSSKL